MLRLTCLPPAVRVFLEGVRGCFRHRHFLVFSWVLVLQAVSNGPANLKALSRQGPSHLAYPHFRRLLCAGYWWSKTLLSWFAYQAICALPPPEDGICYLLADSTFKGKRGKKNPACKKGRLSKYHAYVFGIQLVFLVVHWDVYRIPVDFEIVRKKTDPKYQKENELFRQMLSSFDPPRWARHVIVVADAAYASKANFKAIKKRRWFFVMACARTWKFADGQALRNLVNHLPRYRYRRTWVCSPNGKRRHTYWVYAKRTRLRHIGDVTVVLSKLRRNDGPKKTKILVTNLPKSVSVRKIVAIYQRRWYVELLIGELKGVTGLGQHQVTKKIERVERSIGVSVLAYLMLIKLRTKDIPKTGSWSAFQLQRNFAWEVGQQQLQRSARKLARKWLRERKVA